MGRRGATGARRRGGTRGEFSICSTSMYASPCDHPIHTYIHPPTYPSTYIQTHPTDPPSASHAARPPGDFRPHGANITEDEQLSGKTAFGAVGTKMDPSRVAEEERLKRAAVQGGSLGGAKDGSVQGGSKFSGLGEEGA